MIRAAVLALAAAGCAPMPVAQAERLCRNQGSAGGAQVGGMARIGLSAGPDGTRIERRLDLDVTATTLAGGGEEAWRRCVHRNSGRFPSGPYPS
ncbi:MAG: hypothetical protein ACK4OP_06040 [Gemmobacter sp.]